MFEALKERTTDRWQGITREKLSAIGGGAVGRFMEVVDAEVSAMTPEHVEDRLAALKAGLPLPSEAMPSLLEPPKPGTPRPLPPTPPGPIIPPKSN